MLNTISRYQPYNSTFNKQKESKPNNISQSQPNVKHSSSVAMPYDPSFGRSNKALMVAKKFQFNYPQGIVDITSFPEIPVFKHFDDVANMISLAFYKNRDVKLLAPKSSSPEYAAYSFANQVKEGQYKNQGLTPENTLVAVYKAPSGFISNILSQHKFKKSIQSLLKQRPDKGKNVENIVIFNKETFFFDVKKDLGLKQNLKFVEIRKTYNLEGPFKHEIDVLSDTMQNRTEDAIEMIKLTAPSDADTKEFLKTNKMITREICGSKTTFSDDAIDKAVEITSKYEGAFPEKALDLMKTVSGLIKKEDYQIITAKDIEESMKKHASLYEKPVKRHGNFVVIENTGVKLDDVGGLSQVKQEIRENLLDQLKNPEKYKNAGAELPKGILMYGPPGTGKTMLAKAISGETKIPFFSAEGSQFMEMFVGVGPSRVRDLFNTAKEAARKNPNKTAIVFIDEFDSIASKRTDAVSGGGQEHNNTINQLLAEMDGIKKDSDLNVVVIAATNRLEHLDTAAIRDGRFDIKLNVPNPKNTKERLEILKIHSKDKKFPQEEGAKEKMLANIAETTQGYTGAELENMMKKAATLSAARNAEYITPEILREASIAASAGPVTKMEDMPQSLKESIVVHEFAHAFLQETLEPSSVSYVSLESRGNAYAFMVGKVDDYRTETFESLIKRIAILYAGHDSEKAIFKTSGAGACSDIEKATNILSRAVLEFGFGPRTQKINLKDDHLKKIYTAEIKADIDSMRNTASTVSSMVVDFYKGFLEESIPKFSPQVGTGSAKTIPGEEFAKMMDDWVVKNHKQEKLTQLKQRINEIITESKKLVTESLRN